MQKQNLFVGSLAYATTDDSLKAFFETVGEVERARVATDRDTGRSRGFGFVTFVDEANNWTVYTCDGSLSAQWEHQILITENGPEILSY